MSEWHLKQALERIQQLESSVDGRLEATETQLAKVAAKAKAAVTGEREN